MMIAQSKWYNSPGVIEHGVVNIYVQFFPILILRKEF
jgi:hypothetical protein